MGIKKDKQEQARYDKKRKEYREEIKSLRKELNQADDKERNQVLELEMFIDMLNNSQEYYQRANYVQKGKIAKLLFLNIKINSKKKLLIQPKP